MIKLGLRNEPQPSRANRRTVAKAAAIVASVAALATGCSTTRNGAPAQSAKPAHVYTLKDGKTVDMPFTIAGDTLEGEEPVAPSPFLLQAHKVGQEVLIQVLAGKSGHARPMLMYEDDSNYIVTSSNALDRQLESEGLTPYEFSFDTAAGEVDLQEEVTIPGQEGGEFVTVATNKYDVTTISISDNPSGLPLPLPPFSNQ